MNRIKISLLYILSAILFLTACSNNNLVVKKTFIVSGKESEMVIYYQLSGNLDAYYYVKGDHMQRLYPRFIADSHLLSVTNVRGTSDYYICGYISSSTPEIEMEDEIGTDFQIEIISHSKSPEQKNMFFVYGYLDGYTEDYTITVNGEVYEFISNTSEHSLN